MMHQSHKTGAYAKRLRRRAHKDLRPYKIGAFTLIELLVVIAIIGLMAGIGLATVNNLGKANDLSAGNRQLIDDLAFARFKAINDRTTVYVVFVSPDIAKKSWTGPDGEEVKKLLDRQYSAYALFAKRTLGDQPGPGTARYITDWKTLPEGTLIPTNKFRLTAAPSDPLMDRPMAYYDIPFPNSTNSTLKLPCIAFDYLGRLTEKGDQFIPISKGTIILSQTPMITPPEVIETPRNNYTNNPVVQIDWLTGRARSTNYAKIF
jgi:prepilin-type N-terminal cleavage/methylation domain-containing protein